MWVQIQDRLGYALKRIILTNQDLAGNCNTIGRKFETLVHAIRLMYKSCYIPNNEFVTDQLSQCFNHCIFFTVGYCILWTL